MIESFINTNKLNCIYKTQEDFKQRENALIQLPLITIYFTNQSEESTTPNRWFKTLKAIEKNLSIKFHEPVVKRYLKPLFEIDIEKKFVFKTSTLIFFHSEEFSAFLEIPKHTNNQFFISKSFHIKPVITWIQKDYQYYLLTLSKRSIKLYQGGAIDLKFMNEWKLNDSKDSLKQIDNKIWSDFFKKAENEINKIVSKDNKPIILAGVREQVAFYEKINKDKDLLQYYLSGSTESQSENELKTRCLEILNVIFDEKKYATLKSYQKLKGLGMASDDISEVARLAYEGRVASLVIAEDVNVWGKYNPHQNKISLTKSGASYFCDDLLDDLAELVLSRGGQVLTATQEELPTKNHLVAILKH